jgi:hypothetical protein
MSITDRPTMATQPLPVYDGAAGESLVQKAKPRGHNRRTFLRMSVAVAAGIGLAFSDFMASPFLRWAFADYYQYWNNCSPNNYFSSSQTCVPTSAYFGSDNCDVAYLVHWHRKDSLSTWSAGGSSYKAYYTQNPTSCSNKNAWIWNGNHGTMCSDGNKTRYANDGFGWYVQYDNFSICRTTI